MIRIKAKSLFFAFILWCVPYLSNGQGCGVITMHDTSSPVAFKIFQNSGPQTYTLNGSQESFGFFTVWYLNGNYVPFNSSGQQEGTVTIGGVDIYVKVSSTLTKLDLELLNPEANVNSWSFNLSTESISFTCGTTATSRVVSVSPTAYQSISFGSLSPVGCGAIPFNLNGSASSGLSITYTSSNPSVASISGNTVTIHAIGTTVITASQPGNTSYSAATPVSRSLVVNGITATISSPMSSGSLIDVCSGDLQLSANPGVTGTYSYTWSTGQQGQTIPITSPGTYSVTIASAVTGCSATASSTVTVIPSPTPSINGPETISTSGHQTYTTESSKSNYLWTTSSAGQPYAAPITVWDPNLGIYVTVPGPPAPNDQDTYAVSWASAGSSQTISVTYTDTNGCVGTTAKVLQYGGGSGARVSANPEENNYLIKQTAGIYPNPANSQLKISFGEKLRHPTVVTITSLAGVVVFENEVAVGSEEVTIVTNNLRDGIYYLFFIKDNTIQVSKVMILH